MKNHIVSSLCALIMTAALASLIASGILLWKQDMMPDWNWLTQSAGAICVLAFVGIAVSAVISGVCASSHAERAWRAGPRYAHIRNIALLYAAACVGVDVLAAHVGIQILNGGEIVMPPAWITSAGAVFVALARPLMAYIIQGVDGIAADEALAREKDEHAQTLAEIGARANEARARSDAGVVELEVKRGGLLKAAGGAALAVGAAAAVLGIGPTPQTPSIPEFAQSYDEATPQYDLATQNLETLIDPAGVWERGPRRMNRDKFEQAVAMVRDGADARALSREFGVDAKTGRQWQSWAEAILARADDLRAVS